MSPAALPPADLLEAASALDPDRFERLVGDLLRVRAGRHTPGSGPTRRPRSSGSTPARQPAFGTATTVSLPGWNSTPSPRASTAN